jgi:nitrogen fixation protein FixH
MTRTDYRPGGRPFTGRKMLVAILAFFGVIIAVNGVMAYLAVRDFRGVVVNSSYVASQDFNAYHARFAAQLARGWQVDVHASDGAPALVVTDASGEPIRGLTIAATALRVTDAHADVTLTLAETAPGVYATDIALAPGRWDIEIAADGHGPRYAARYPLLVEPRR